MQFEPSERFREDAAVYEGASGARTEVRISEPPLEAEHLTEPFDIPPREWQLTKLRSGFASPSWTSWDGLKTVPYESFCVFPPMRHGLDVAQGTPSDSRGVKTVPYRIVGVRPLLVFGPMITARSRVGRVFSAMTAEHSRVGPVFCAMTAVCLR